MATTQTSGGVKKIRSGKRPTVQDAGIAAARLRSSRNGNGNGHAAAAADARPPSMIPAVPVVTPPNKREELMRIDALETQLARANAKIALMEDTIEYLRIHSSWPAEWVIAHGGAVEPGPDDPVDPEQETVEIHDGEASATEEPAAAEETTPAADTETPSETSATVETSDPEPSAG